MLILINYCRDPCADQPRAQPVKLARGGNVPISLTQLRKDLQYIHDKYGEIYDYCGCWCHNDKFQKLLDNPTRKTAFEILKGKLDYYFDSGYDVSGYHRNLPVESDKQLQEIKERWNI